MNQPPIQKNGAPTSGLEFKDFWTYISGQLGNSRLHINSNAQNIKEFIDPHDDSKEYLKTSIRESYKRSNCHHLRSEICVNAVLDILGETAYSLHRNNCDDLFDIELLEEIAWHIIDRYRHLLQIKQSTPQSKNLNKSARVASFPDYRIKRANSRQ